MTATQTCPACGQATQPTREQLLAKIAGLEKDLNHLFDSIPGRIDYATGRDGADIQLPHLRARCAMLEAENTRAKWLLKRLGYDMENYARKIG